MLKVSKVYNPVKRSYLPYLQSDGKVYVTLLNDSEACLNGGRFKFFVADECNFIVRLPRPVSDAATLQKLDWIGDHADTNWSLDVEEETHDPGIKTGYTYVYSFDDLGTAVQFKMTFADIR